MQNCESHEKCVKNTIDQVRKICQKNNLRLTPLREKILEIICQDHKAVKAYDVLSELKKHNISDKPPTIYRALDFFIKNNIIHKIHSLNSYVVCPHPGKHQDCYFLICQECHEIEESCNKNISNAITSSGENKGFSIEKTNVEIFGICKKCSK